MNLTLHLIRKDLRALRWALLLWTAVCLTHLGLRLAQHARTDSAPLTPFWRLLETSDRWDHLALIMVPILIVPLLLHLDPLRGTLAFWKTVPVSRGRLLTAKAITLVAFFVALPFACEVIYFLKAGLSIVIATALADWAWRFLPGLAAIVLGCAFTRSLKVGVPGVAIALALAAWFFQWPYGRDRVANPFLAQAKPAPRIIAPPDGARIEIEPKSVSFARTNYTEGGSGQMPRTVEERLAIALKLRVSGLPQNVLVKGVRVKGASVHLPGRVVAESAGEFGPWKNAGPTDLPAQERREEFGNSGYNFNFRELDANEWMTGSSYFRIAAKDLPPNGAPVEGKVLVSLARKRLITTLAIEEGEQWRPGLHRFTISKVSPPEWKGASFHATLSTVLADPRGDTAGLAITPATNFVLWIEHNVLPYRKHLVTIPSSAWRAARRPGSRFPIGLASVLGTDGATDITRSRKRTDFEPFFDPIESLRNEATPLAIARFAEEQSQTRNWHLAIVTYDDLGTVELPFKAVAPRPPIAREEDNSEELKPSPRSLGITLAEVVVPANLSRTEAQKILARLVELAAQRDDDSIRRHENDLIHKLTALGSENIEVLLTAATDAAPMPRHSESAPRHRREWLLPWTDPPPFWRRVIIAACDLARPEDKALILRFHSPKVDLMRSIEPRGWEGDAIPVMCAIAANERVPPSWLDVLARNPGPLTQAALLAQIRQRNVTPERLAQLIASGAVPARKAAETMWETVVASTGEIENLMPAFPVAAKHGVEIIPRDLLRILRLRREDALSYTGTPFKTVQSGFVQSFSLRSDCPPTVGEAAAWLEQNALALQFDGATGRYEFPGKAAPALDLSKWGSFIDPFGTGSARLDGNTLILTCAGFIASGRAGPHLLREIEGDFTVEVTVQPVFDLAPAWSRREYEIFQSAGLIVLADEQRHLRWEHAVWKSATGHELREETFRSGRTYVDQRANKEWDPAKPVRLRVSRHGDLFATAWKQDGGAWAESPAARNLGWPAKVRIGPLAGNHLTHPFTARFTDYSIVPSSTEPTRVATPIVPHPDGEATPAGTKLGDWGTVENPIGAGIFKVEGNTLSIDVAPKFADYQIQQQMTAPRVLNEIDGDFTLEVTIAPTAKKYWSSAELLLTAGPDFYFRIGRAANNGDRPQFTYDYAERGRPEGMMSLDAQRDLSKPIRIRLQRRGSFVHIAHQQDAENWMEFYPLDVRHWPGKIQAGVVALNTSREPFTAVFSDLKLTRDKPAPP